MKSLARYATTNAITRTMLSELLTRQDFESIIRTDSLPSAWLALRKTPYGVWIPEDVPPDILSIEKTLRQATAARFKRSIHALRGKPREVGVILLSRWELDNLEFALRLWHSRDSSLQHLLIFPSLIHEIPVYDVVEAETLEEIALLLRHTPYFEPVSGAVKVYREKRSIFFVEVALERDYYRRLLDAVKELGGSDAAQAAKIVSAEIDMLNLSWLARLVEYYEFSPAEFHQYMIPGPSEISRRLADSSVTADTLREITSGYIGPGAAADRQKVSPLDAISLIENMVQEMAVDVARKSLGGYPFSIGCVFAFYLLKRVELRNLHAALSGQVLGREQQEIMDRLYGLR